VLRRLGDRGEERADVLALAGGDDRALGLVEPRDQLPVVVAGPQRCSVAVEHVLERGLRDRQVLRDSRQREHPLRDEVASGEQLPRRSAASTGSRGDDLRALGGRAALGPHLPRARSDGCHDCVRSCWPGLLRPVKPPPLRNTASARTDAACPAAPSRPRSGRRVAISGGVGDRFRSSRIAKVVTSARARLPIGERDSAPADGGGRSRYPARGRRSCASAARPGCSDLKVP
jgi:hypothetical protein